MDYHISINNDETKNTLINELDHSDIGEILSSLEFRGAVFVAKPVPEIRIAVLLKSLVDAEFFSNLRKHTVKTTSQNVSFDFEFCDAIPREELVEKYWEFFIETLNGEKVWLEHTVAKYNGKSIWIQCKGDFVFQKLSERKINLSLKRGAFSFFGIDADIKIVKAEEKEGTEEVKKPTEIKITSKKAVHSKILTNEDVTGNEIDIENISEEGRYVIEGRVFVDDDYKRELKNKKGTYIIIFYITNNKDTIKTIVFADEGDEFIERVKTLGYVRAYVDVSFDEREGDLTAKAKKIKVIEVKKRCDTCEEKRVELHAHTKMSAMDSVMSVKDYIKTAISWGHKAVAVTDHGVVHSFPEAYSLAGKTVYDKDGNESRESFIKLILGLEGYLVEDEGTYNDKNTKTNHIIILVKNETGLKNLYRIISKSHLDYFYKKPRIPRKLLDENREGLVLGTACCYGEMFSAMVRKKSDEEIERIADYYDYYEVQPDTNNEFYIRNGDFSSVEELHDINRKIIEFGEKKGKPVVATSDAHFLDEEDIKYREVLMLAMGFDEAKARLHLKTTDEMLEEFAYLGEEKAKEIVVTNTHKVSDMINDDVRPVPKDAFLPTIDNSDEEISKTSWDTAYKIYGMEMPSLIKERIERELNAIIGNKYSVLYTIAKMMVEKSNKDGYIVGSRGSVGSSIIAFLCGISEVNPLPAHYICGNCKYTDFVETDLVGVDIPEKKCPKCGEMLNRDGFNIPFETFMGFKGEKMPDIDLNFSGDYQEKIHNFVIDMFGKDKVIKAGTISPIKEKAVRKDFLSKYIEKTGNKMKDAEMNRIAKGCSGVKRSTGQHPGGLMLVPSDKDIYDFTPIQNAPKSDVITTHFDYHWIHDTLVKIDALGHDMPTSLKRITEGLNIEVDDIPINDEETMKIFSGVKPLGVDPKNYEPAIGTIGVPEFGTKFVREMLNDTKPKTFSELVYISGLSHGTNVWLGNARDLIKNKTATLKEVISVRDDIMNYLISKGMPKAESFQITEKVRKGKGLTPENEKSMKSHNVPAWYIDSCKKIKYMFPKAHAVAYTIMSVRIAYVKVHHPMYFYADYFSRNADNFEYEYAFYDVNKIKNNLKEFKLKRMLTAKEKNMSDIMEVLFEMKDRGIEFANVDIYESEPNVFKVKDEKVLLPFTVVPELGGKVAALIGEERKKAPFSSIEDLAKRTKVNKNVIEFLLEKKIISDMPASDQAVLF